MYHIRLFVEMESYNDISCNYLKKIGRDIEYIFVISNEYKNM